VSWCERRVCGPSPVVLRRSRLGRTLQACWDGCILQSPATTMKCRVTCYVAGRVFTVDCYAANYSDARRVALAQYPNATIISVNAVF
jgi:hypothetical protein